MSGRGTARGDARARARGAPTGRARGRGDAHLCCVGWAGVESQRVSHESTGQGAVARLLGRVFGWFTGGFSGASSTPQGRKFCGWGGDFDTFLPLAAAAPAAPVATGAQCAPTSVLAPRSFKSRRQDPSVAGAPTVWIPGTSPLPTEASCFFLVFWSVYAPRTRDRRSSAVLLLCARGERSRGRARGADAWPATKGTHARHSRRPTAPTRAPSRAATARAC